MSRTTVAHQASSAREARREGLRAGLGLLLVGGLTSALSGCAEPGNRSSRQGAALAREPQLFIVRSDAGGRRQLTHRQIAHRSPSWSPDGRQLVYTAGCAIEAIRPDGSRRRALLRRDRRCPTVVSWSPQGDLIAFAAHAEDPGPSTIETVKPGGSDLRRIDEFYDERGADEGDGPAWSPHGKRIAYSRFVPVPRRPGEVVSPSRARLVSARADGRGIRRLTAGEAFDASPDWSPDGRNIAFIRVRDARLGLVVVDGRGGSARRVVADLIDLDSPVWSPSGRQIAFSGVTARGDRRYHLYVVDASGRRRRQLTGEEPASAPAWSPDGTRIAYVDDNSRVRVVAPDGGDQRTLLKLPGGEISALAWSPDGRQLAFTARKQPPED